MITWAEIYDLAAMGLVVTGASFMTYLWIIEFVNYLRKKLGD